MIKNNLLFVLIWVIAIPVCAKDGDQVTLQAGSANVIWTLNSAYFETNYAEANVEGITWDQWLQKKGDDYVRDWPTDKQKVDTYFMERFNKKTKKKNGLILQNTNPNDTYRFIFHFNDIDMGDIGGGVVASVFLGAFAKKAGGVNFKSGYVDIVESTTGKVVCRLSFKDVKGNSGMSMSAQLFLALEDLHDELIGFAERFKDKQLPEITVSAIPTASQPQQVPVQKTTTSTKKTSATAPVTAQVTSSQGQQVTVKLKSGTTITGTMKSFDPMTQIVVVVAGQETTIPMTKVANVEMAQTTPTQPTPPTSNQSQSAQSTAGKSLGNQKLIVTEAPDKPERISINIGAIPVEMVLVKGGRMNMGYDGKGSRRMNSEPVHEVAVTSFYISVQPLPASYVTQIVGTRNVDGIGNEPAQVRGFDDVEKVIAAINNQTGRNLRLPTEAEWEYAASGDMQTAIFSIANGRSIAYEWCGDFLDDFSKDGMVMTDPTGPTRGNQHVIRAFNGERGKYDRSGDVNEDDAYLAWYV